MFSVRSIPGGKIELESLIVLTQYNLAATDLRDRNGNAPEQNRRIGCNTLLLQMINPGAGAKRSKLRSRRRREPSGGGADQHLARTSDSARQRSHPQERSGVRQR
jgi:hypothetical protein